MHSLQCKPNVQNEESNALPCCCKPLQAFRHIRIPIAMQWRATTSVCLLDCCVCVVKTKLKIPLSFLVDAHKAYEMNIQQENKAFHCCGFTRLCLQLLRNSFSLSPHSDIKGHTTEQNSGAVITSRFLHFKQFNGFPLSFR